MDNTSEAALAPRCTLFHRVTPATAAFLADGDPLRREIFTQDAPIPVPLCPLIAVARDRTIELGREWDDTEFEPPRNLISLEFTATITPAQWADWEFRPGEAGPRVLLIPAEAVESLRIHVRRVVVHAGYFPPAKKKSRSAPGWHAARAADEAWQQVLYLVVPVLVAIQAGADPRQSSVSFAVEDGGFEKSIDVGEFRRRARRFALAMSPRSKTGRVNALYYYTRMGSGIGRPAFPQKRGDPETNKYIYRLEIDKWLMAGGFPEDVDLGISRQDTKMGRRFAQTARMNIAKRALEEIWLSQELLVDGRYGKGCAGKGCGRRCWPRPFRSGPRHEYKAPSHERAPNAPKDVPFKTLTERQRRPLDMAEDGIALCWACKAINEAANNAEKMREKRKRKKHEKRHIKGV